MSQAADLEEMRIKSLGSRTNITLKVIHGELLLHRFVGGRLMQMFGDHSP
jgi:hypothetical protein